MTDPAYVHLGLRISHHTALEVKFTARGHEANFTNTVVAPGDLFIFCISSPLEAEQKGAQQKGVHACMCVYISVCDVP